ncbi:MAG: hypothetical protein H7336_02675 [Bacteriovorax sp.]|nr:hypothetical protein [Bacteriovorax sp.]
MGKIKSLVITIDIDNDFISTPLESPDTLFWTGLTIGLPKILEIFNSTAKANDSVLAITIFCRADWQIEKIMGQAEWVFLETNKIISSGKYQHLNIDLQWHPHLYEENDGKWFQSHDNSIQRNQLIDIHNKLINAGIDVKCTRIGECFFNNNILETLVELKIKFDSTAFPGRDIGHTNWKPSPTHPYHPDLSNFTSEGNQKILEVPFSMLSIHAPYERAPNLRYLNLIFSPEYTTSGIKDYSENFIVTILHPYEILTLNQPNTHKLFGPENSISENVNLITSHLKTKSILVKDIT